MLNGVQIVGTVRETDVKTYPDGAVITHFKLDCPRATRVYFNFRFVNKLHENTFAVGNAGCRSAGAAGRNNGDAVRSRRDCGARTQYTKKPSRTAPDWALFEFVCVR